MDTAHLLAEVDRLLPFVAKPTGMNLSFHKDACEQCKYLREDLEHCKGPELSPDGLREIYKEMACLSAEGWRWAIPSYLKHCLTVSADGDEKTEFLIYNLGPAPEDQAATRQRLSAFSEAQLGCLVQFLDWCAAHEHWARYCGDDIARARAFVNSLRTS